MPQLFVGTSGWAYPSWKPDFYPAKLAQKKFLGHYATQLNTVEVNFTFRQLVKETTILNWINETPAHFRFGIKAHQVITHIKRLKGTEDFVPRFLATIEPLASAGKLGPVLFQLPPNLKADAALLKEFLALLPRTLPAAFEFRHESWFTDSTWELLKSARSGLVRGGDGRENHAGRGHRAIRLLQIPQAELYTGRTQCHGRAHRRASWRPAATSSLTSSMRKRRRVRSTQWTCCVKLAGRSKVSLRRCRARHPSDHF